jgi:hypothetical protein
MTNKNSSYWFEVLEELGERPMMSFATYNKINNQVDWWELPHKEFDGYGGVFHLAKSLDISPEEIDVKVSGLRRPSFLEKIKALIKYHPESKLRQTLWKSFDRKREGVPYKGHLYFSQLEVDEIKKRAKQERSSIHLFILSKLDHYISKNFLQEGEERWWMIPINMREDKLANLDENYSSYISAQITNKSTCRDINKQLIGKMKGFTHWAAWFWMRLFQYLGKKTIHKALSYFDQNEHGWTGVFTFFEYKFIGSESNPKVKEKLFFGMAPVTKAHPFACDFF